MNENGIPEIKQWFQEMRGNRSQEEIYSGGDDPRFMIARSTYQNIEYGITAAPRKDTMDRIARTLGQDPDRLYSEYMRLQKKNDMEKQELKQRKIETGDIDEVSNTKKRSLIIGSLGTGKWTMMAQKMKSIIASGENIIAIGEHGEFYRYLKYMLIENNYNCVSLNEETYNWDLFKSLPDKVEENDEQLKEFVTNILRLSEIETVWQNAAEDLLVASILTAKKPYSFETISKQMEKITHNEIKLENAPTALKNFSELSEDVRNSAYLALSLKFKRLSGKDEMKIGNLNTDKTFLYTDSYAMYDFNYKKVDFYLIKLIKSTKNSKVPLHIFIEGIDNLQLLAPQISKFWEYTKNENVVWYIGIDNIVQLKAYGKSNAQYIIDHSDYIVYLGGNDQETADFISDLVNQNNDKLAITPNKLRTHNRNKAIVIERNKKQKIVEHSKLLFNDFQSESYKKSTEMKKDAGNSSTERAFLDRISDFFESRSVVTTSYSERYNRYKLIILKTIVTFILLVLFFGMLVSNEYLRNGDASVLSTTINLTKQEQIELLLNGLGVSSTLGMAMSLFHYVFKKDGENPSSPYFYACILLALIPLLKVTFF